MLKSLRNHLLSKIIKAETSYLLSSLIMFSALFFILFMLFMSKEIFIHYSDSKSMLLPKSMILTTDDLSTVKKKLKAHNISPQDVLIARVKNYNDLAIYTNINRQKSLPKNFTLLSFDINTDEKILLECQGKTREVTLLKISLKHHKDWLFKTKILKDCEPKSDVTLITPNSKIKMILKRNDRYTKLLYKTDKATDKEFYTYLINLEEKLFIKYFAYSKFFNNKESSLTQETKEHAKMLSSLFRLIFANNKQKVMLNHESYSFLTAYKKIPFKILPIHPQYTKELTVLDELALNIQNSQTPFYKQLIIANLSSLPNITYDTTLIFFKKETPNIQDFTDAIIINRDDFLTLQENASLKINIAIYVIAGILFILMLALINSFITRNYKLYREKFSIFIFYGFRFKIVTTILTLLVLLSLFLSYILSIILLEKVNNIFNLYYVDLIGLEFEYYFIIGFYLLSMFFAYITEAKAQKEIATKDIGE